jgi:hypothetical protein
MKTCKLWSSLSVSCTLKYHKSDRFPSQWTEVENVVCIDQKRVLLMATCVNNSFHSKCWHIFNWKFPGAYVPRNKVKARLFFKICSTGSVFDVHVSSSHVTGKQNYVYSINGSELIPSSASSSSQPESRRRRFEHFCDRKSEQTVQYRVLTRHTDTGGKKA